MNDYEIGLEDRETGKRWAGENYGWQSQKSFEELYVQGKLNPAQQQIERITSSVTRAVTADPILGPTIKAVGGGLKTVFSALPQPIQQTVAKGVELQQTAAENIAAATGLPVSVTDPFTIADIATGGAAVLGSKSVRQAVKGAAKDLMPPPGPPMQPAMAMAGGTPSIRNRGGGVGLDFTSPQVMPLTITKPERLAPGIREGIAKEPEIAKQLTKRAGDILKQENRLVTWREFGGPRSAKNIKKAQADVYSKKSTMPQLVQDDPIAYRVAEYKDAAKINLEQHHLFTKAQSSAFVDRMQELIEKNIADADDLVAMGEYAKHLGAAMGDVNSNMFNMHTKPHNIFHTKMRKAGQEVKPDVLMQQLRKAKNADELMDMFHDYIVDNVLPNKKAAKEAQAAWEIANPDLYGAQKASAMDIFIKELRERGA